ncbi:putative O-methyltransferase [Podospora appendiculata]|uniref:O-methyltransferase n=1 Tax=Podospora appendiculata TaxID=314037 RepID=A0AAE0WZL9_9PEZI|nr:putative O-methyltransferase [Podospora appendiculata]
MPTATDTLLPLAQDILKHTQELVKILSAQSFSPPSLAVGASTALWTTHDGEIEEKRSQLCALMQRLDKLVQGPRGFLHEYVSGNWEYGALYTLLEFDVLQKIPLRGTASVETLAEQARLPADKLLRICRLVACADILDEVEEGVFGHTAISEELVDNEGFRSWVAFQLFETRVASAHLADSLRHPDPFWNGQAAFEHAWGMPMYAWHAKHPEKGKRFALAMDSVSKTLDPGNGMITNWFREQPWTQSNTPTLIVDIDGKTGSFATDLAELFPNLHFEVQDSSPSPLAHGEQALPPGLRNRITFRLRDLFTERTPHDSPVIPRVLMLRSALWRLDDTACVQLLRSFIPLLQHPDKPTLLVNDLVSLEWDPDRGPDAERPFRRRDVTVMVMHNAKQRTSREWAALFAQASPRFDVVYTQALSSHSCRGMWLVRWGGAGGEEGV